MTFAAKLAIACTLGLIAGRIRVRAKVPLMAIDEHGDPSPSRDETVTIPVVGEMDIEQKKVFEWRHDQLVAQGFDELRAVTLALRPGNEWRRAIEHVRRGADPKIAADIEL